MILSVAVLTIQSLYLLQRDQDIDIYTSSTNTKWLSFHYYQRSQERQPVPRNTQPQQRQPRVFMRELPRRQSFTHLAQNMNAPINQVEMDCFLLASE